VIGCSQQGYIETVPNRCRTCFTCVRDCPAKAIRMKDGQAQVVPSRCIVCGNCVRVCTQQAKRVVSTLGRFERLLGAERRVAACLAPSFPAEFSDIAAPRLVGALRALGCTYVAEVAFGADLVAARYAEMIASNQALSAIATTCPAVTCFVEKQYPQLIPKLAQLVSPMVATARVLRREYGDDLAVVFIGPCAAKKMEADVGDDVDVALTFRELRELLATRNIDLYTSDESEFDPPHPNLGALFPLTRGMLQASKLKEDLTALDVVVTEGHTGFAETLRELAAGSFEPRLLEALCCNGCIMGVGMSSTAPLHQRRAAVASYVRNNVAQYDKRAWHADMRRLGCLDLGRQFVADDQRLPTPPADEIAAILLKMGKSEPNDELDCGACGYATCREHAQAIWRGLAESEMCLPYTIDTLHDAIQQLAQSHQLLASTQQALMQSEKLASMGQLAAGIAHEVNNPLGVVLMYAHLLKDSVSPDSPNFQDLTLLAEQTERCRKIVAGLLNFARQNRVLYQEVRATDLMNRCLVAVNPPPSMLVERDYPPPDTLVELDPDQIQQVLTNLLTNACAAMQGTGTLKVRIAVDDAEVTFQITDTGSGIRKHHLDKIFEPFFTTKAMGHGTGLGLSVAYGIVKMHSGQITVVSNSDPEQGPTGSTFSVRLLCHPRLE